MPDRPTQNFENHVRHDKLAYVYILILSLSLGLAGWGLAVSSHKYVAVAVVLNTIGTVLLATNARSYGLKVQDRVIRLEMRLRLAELLSGDLAGRAKDFTLSQLVGLRFASDEELPALAQKVFDEKISKAGDIKRLVKDWQPDFLRV